MISDKKPVQDFVSLLTAHGIEHVIITPGSRNAPFSISLLNYPGITSHSIVDERSAGFVALGMAQQLSKPVVLICTSGTAALNFAPAIAEAYYQRIPLLIITADRPMEWIDQGEGQSIRQRDLHRNYVKASCEIAEEAHDGDLVWYNVRVMDEAIRLCTEGVPGPVHINFPLRESLYKTVDNHDRNVKMIRTAATEISIHPDELKVVKTRLAQSKKVMVLAGQLPDQPELESYLTTFAQRDNVIVFTEAHSNLSSDTFITTIDRLIMGFDKEKKKYILPDILITIGRNIISRKIKEVLRAGETEHWHIDISGEGLDTLKNLRRIFPISPIDFFRSIQEGEKVSIDSDYRKTINVWNEKARTVAAQYLEHAPWSDLSAFRIIHDAIPRNSDVQMGNSSVVRYILLNDSRGDLRYFGNRGVAGIDGCSSTAVGASFITGKLTTLITGDVAFFYDGNAFWNEMITANLKVIVINNGGGGIFRIIEGPNKTGEALEKFFETKHNRTAESFAAMYQLNYHSSDSVESLRGGLKWLYQTNQCAILEVFTPRLENDQILKQFFTTIKNEVYQNDK
ncbi:MAG: 2-succinyl-5-enolpyruvyl-6-hydroxy-3-cyclohexene-1-carboxylic-acid synthase [Flavobacteriales bacterium]|nr:2-succinyl-5-enolpyruvyl-6-hydroxy-3-cyclohexene-1-carboxylic-acid synthase [Flavobacteriales bacterium]